MGGLPSSLSLEQQQAAVAFFEQGAGFATAASWLGVSKYALRQLFERWQLRGDEALVRRSGGRPRYSLEFKLEVVQRHQAGDTAAALAEELGLSSPQLVRNWSRVFRREGEEGLRPKRPGPRPKDASPSEMGELERLQEENLRLRAEVAYLGKLRALMEQKRK